jgi:uncharacterized membrane protein
MNAPGEPAHGVADEPPHAVPREMTATPLTMRQRTGRRVAVGTWIALAVLCVCWETWLAPIRPGGSWLALKALPLLLPLRGLWRGDAKSFQWALLLVLAYLLEGSVRVFDAPPAGALAWVELLLVALFFVAAIVYLRPFKRAAKARQAAAR